MMPTCLGSAPTISAAGGIYFIDGTSAQISYGDGYTTLTMPLSAHPSLHTRRRALAVPAHDDATPRFRLRATPG